MTKDKTVTMSRETLEKCLRDALLIRFEQDSHVEELRALLAAPVVERQPSCSVCMGSGWIDSLRSVGTPAKDCPACSPPALVSVALPDYVPEPTTAQVIDPDCNYSTGHAEGWDACLDKVKEMNQ